MKTLFDVKNPELRNVSTNVNVANTELKGMHQHKELKLDALDD